MTARAAIHSNGRFFAEPFACTSPVDDGFHTRKPWGMSRALATIALLVFEYDEAIRYFRDKLGFELVHDSDLGGGKRWVVVSPTGGGGARILLARADGDQQRAIVGNQGGGRVMFFLETSEFAADHQRLLASGVRFLEQPRHEPYGSVAVFADLYGNKWDLIEPKR
jgi:catechol 2,3-dioxygenase-like lactoylglutathione lyase family enzyme